MLRRQVLGAAALTFGVLPALTRTARAQAGPSYPDRPVRLVVPFPPGGSTDLQGRLLGQILGTRFGQPVVIENFAGAGGTIGAARVAQSAADGYTLLAGTSAPITVNPHLLPNLPYDPLRAFAPVARVGDSSLVAVVASGSPFRTLGELLARARAQPETVTYASSGIGSFSHLGGALLEARAGVKMTHVSYRGGGPAISDVLAGRVDAMLENYSTLQSYISAGQLRSIAVGAVRRLAQLPDTPTMAELGIPDYSLTAWFGLFAPAGTAEAIIQTLHAAVTEGLRQPTVAAQLAEWGVDSADESSDRFADFVREQYQAMGTLLANAGIK